MEKLQRKVNKISTCHEHALQYMCLVMNTGALIINASTSEINTNVIFQVLMSLMKELEP